MCITQLQARVQLPAIRVKPKAVPCSDKLILSLESRENNFGNGDCGPQSADPLLKSQPLYIHPGASVLRRLGEVATGLPRDERIEEAKGKISIDPGSPHLHL